VRTSACVPCWVVDPNLVSGMPLRGELCGRMDLVSFVAAIVFEYVLIVKHLDYR
jgi:hypothetical protein